LGSGIDFSTSMQDDRAIVVLRELQRKISNGHRFELLRENAIRPLT
jgi:hypothetical protein